jgi:hypothetical protein
MPLNSPQITTPGDLEVTSGRKEGRPKAAYGNYRQVLGWRRSPGALTNPSNGQHKSQVRFAFWMSGEPLTTTELMKKCFFLLPSQREIQKLASCQHSASC